MWLIFERAATMAEIMAASATLVGSKLAAFKEYISFYLEQPRPRLQTCWRTVEDAALLATLFWPP